MNRLRSGSLVKWLLVLVALVPAGLFAYLGHFSRVIGDDYCIFSYANEMGTWGSTLYQLNRWTGAYSRSLLHGLLAPVDIVATSLAPFAMILILFVGCSWVILHIPGFRMSQLPSRMAMIALAALVVGAWANGALSLEPIYWFNANTTYALPLALLIVNLAFSLRLARKLRANFRWCIIVAVNATGFFIIAGASEMYLVFQLTLVSSFVFLIVLFFKASERRAHLIILGAGLMATFAGLILQLSSPGIYNRMSIDARDIVPPLRSLPDLVLRSVELTFQYVGHQESFTGFMLLMGAGLFLALVVDKPAPPQSDSGAFSFSTPTLWLGIMVQLIFFPILWTHSSDLSQVFGRFSYGFALVVFLNAAMILIFLLLIWRRRQFELTLRKSQNGWKICCSLILVAILVFFALTQLRSIHYRAATYLFTSSLALIGMLTWQLTSVFPDTSSRRYWLAAVLASTLPILIIATLVCVSLYGHGFISERAMVPAAFVQVVPGLIWGGFVGFLLQRVSERTDVNSAWIRWIKVSGLAVASVIAIGIVVGHGKLIPDFSTFAQEWDARHQQILDLRDSGLSEIEVAPLSFDLSEYLWDTNMGSSVENRCARRYYRLDSIQLADS